MMHIRGDQRTLQLSERKGFSAFLLAGLLSFAAPAHASLPELLTESRQMITTGANKLAFERLSQAELDYAGTPEFDYWLGVAAVRSGNASLGLLALDRLLLVQPSHAGGRLERAFALIQLGMLDQADEALNELQQLNPPKKAAEVIAQYRDAIKAKRQRDNSPSHLVVLSAGGGYDSNVNSAPSDYVLELFGGLFQSQVTNEDSLFSDLKLQYVGNWPLNSINSVQLIVAGQGRQYQQTDVQAYNLGLVQGQANWRYAPSADLVVNSKADLVQVYSGSPYDALFTQYGLRSSVDIPVFLESRLETALGWRSLSYDASSVNNLDALTAEAGLKIPLDSQWQLQSKLTFEQEWADQRDGGDALRVKALVGAGYKLNPAHQLNMSLTGQWLRYQDKGFALYNDLQPLKRSDQSLQASADWNWTIAPAWSLGTQAGYRMQRSSLDFFDYNQFSVSTSLTYLWR